MIKAISMVLVIAMLLSACGTLHQNTEGNGSQVEIGLTESMTGTVRETEHVSDSEELSEMETNSETEIATEIETQNPNEEESSSETNNQGFPNESENDNQTEEPSEVEYTYRSLDKVMYVISSLNVREAPNTSGKKLGTLQENTEVHVTGQCNETLWYRIDYDGKEAYVSNNYLQEAKVNVEPIAINKVMYATKSLYIKSKPSEKASNKTSVWTGGETMILFEQNGWYGVQCHDGNVGYVQTKYITDDPKTVIPPKADSEDEYYVNWNGHIVHLTDYHSQASREYYKALAYAEYGEVVFNKESGRCGALIPNRDSVLYPYASEKEYKVKHDEISSMVYRAAEMQGYIIGREDGPAIGGGGNFDASGHAYLLEAYFIDPRKEIVDWNGHDIGIFGMSEERIEYIKSLAEAEYFTIKSGLDYEVFCGIVVPDKSYLEQGYDEIEKYVSRFEHYGIMEDNNFEDDKNFLYRDYAFDTKTGAWIIEFYYSKSVK